MAVSDRLLTLFKRVPGVTSADTAEWLTEAIAESGLQEGINLSDDNALLYLAYSIGCRAIAADAARYFQYSDGEESVNKSKIFDNYMRLASDAYSKYLYYRNGGGSRTLMLKRADGR